MLNFSSKNHTRYAYKRYAYKKNVRDYFEKVGIRQEHKEHCSA